MKLTTKFRYGSRAILEIARGGNSRPIKKREIATNQGIPESYLENILIDLKNRGLIKASRGPNGGFSLRGKPEDISLLDVANVFEGCLALVDCVDSPEDCGRVDNCATRLVWKQLQTAQEEVLKAATLKNLLNGVNSSGDLTKGV